MVRREYDVQRWKPPEAGGTVTLRLDQRPERDWRELAPDPDSSATL